MENYTWAAMGEAIKSLGSSSQSHAMEMAKREESLKQNYMNIANTNAQTTFLAEQQMRKNQTENRDYNDKQEQKFLSSASGRESQVSQQKANERWSDFTSKFGDEDHVAASIAEKTNTIKDLASSVEDKADLLNAKKFKFSASNLDAEGRQKHNESVKSLQRFSLYNDKDIMEDFKKYSQTEEFQADFDLAIEEEGLPFYEWSDAALYAYFNPTDVSGSKPMKGEKDTEKPYIRNFGEQYNRSIDELEKSSTYDSYQRSKATAQELIALHQADMVPFVEANRIHQNKYMKIKGGSNSLESIQVQKKWEKFALDNNLSIDQSVRFANSMQNMNKLRVEQNQAQQELDYKERDSTRRNEASLTSSLAQIEVGKLGIVASQAKQQSGAGVKFEGISVVDERKTVKEYEESIDTILANLDSTSDKFAKLALYSNDLFEDKKYRELYKKNLKNAFKKVGEKLTEKEFKALVEEFHNLQNSPGDIKYKIKTGSDGKEFRSLIENATSRKAKNVAAAIRKTINDKLKDLESSGVGGMNGYSISGNPEMVKHINSANVLGNHMRSKLGIEKEPLMVIKKPKKVKTK